MNTHHKYFLLLFFLFAINAFAQKKDPTKILDSLLLHHPQKDTTRVKMLSTYVQKIYYRDTRKADSLIKEVEKLSQEINYTKGKADANYYRGEVQVIKSDYSASVGSFKKAIELYEKIGRKPFIANCLNRIGASYYHQGNFSEALEFYNKSASMCKEINNLKGASIILNNIANIYADQGKYFEAIKNYNESKEIKQKINYRLGLAKTHTNLGSIYGALKDFPQALENLNRALNIYDSIENNTKTSVLLLSIGVIHSEQKQVDSALVYYEKALKFYKKLDDQRGIADCLGKIGNIYANQSKKEKSLDFFFKSLEISKKINDERGIAMSYLNIAQVYYFVKKYKKALEYTLKTKEIADKLNILKFQKETSGILSAIYEYQGKYEKSLATYKKFKTFNDSLLSKDANKKIIKLEYEYKYKQELASANQRELRLTQEVKTTNQDLEKSQRNLLLGVIAFLLVTLVLAAIIFFLRLRHVKAKNANILTEQKLLRSQMTPHFIFNALSVLQGIILNKEQKKSLLYLSKFSKLLRITLENSRDKLVSLNQELIAVENYLALHNIESNQAYDYSIVVDEVIDKSLFEIPPMLIQPFIENAIEHGFNKLSEDRNIDIVLNYTDEELVCTITDNGIGIDSQKEKSEKHKKSLATIITSERLRILSEDSKTKGKLMIEDRQKYNSQGTIVTLIIPHKIQKAL
ncbi:tetratricopeptide repeat protein [Kordia sp.]|uniref:tetratricopeptide repeat-containing sensor histidine kinase n=1 Tax=Kordia sp. TaxID=1965332 RepID=UPI0025B7C7DB|nr:tetratricopeptide repeat protein [Kordia sp.]MCH2196994.1 tetratricopeptide repeat protein [Kordia sp.]